MVQCESDTIRVREKFKTATITFYNKNESDTDRLFVDRYTLAMCSNKSRFVGVTCKRKKVGHRRCNKKKYGSKIYDFLFSLQK
jgi:hypothetical protein